MPDPKPWRLADPLPGPYPARATRPGSATDRLATWIAAPVLARIGPGARAYRRRLADVAAHAAELRGLGDDSLRAAAASLRPSLRAKGLTQPLVARSLALVTEAARRHVGIRYYPEQLIGGWAMTEGCLIEMATGEGKTVTAVLAAATAALAGMTVHVVTVNDYLAERDLAQTLPVYRALGLSAACILADDDAPARAGAYAADVTYVTGKELAFDYLRDGLAIGAMGRDARLALGPLVGNQAVMPALRLRGLGFALIDEADSVLIDEARTPMIIAQRNPAGHAFDFDAALRFADRLRPGIDYRVEGRAAELTAPGRAALATDATDLGGLWRFSRAREEMAEQALAALHLFHRDRDYILRDGKVEIVDENTGRVAEGRHWERGLQQLIEAKEQVELSPQDVTAARITCQSYFRRYARLSGMTGTAAEHAAELVATYGLRTVRVPTHRPVRRRCLGRRAFATSAERWAAVVEAAAAAAARGQPVLIGTRTVAASDRLAALLSARGLAHTILNARHDREEAAVVARAGQRGRITVATNMAGRGTDIRLAPGVAASGGLHVIVTEFNDSPRIDRQLIGRAARQGDPGSWEALVSREDALFRDDLPGMFRRHGPLRLIRRLAQYSAEHRHAKQRRAMQAWERQRQKTLAFSGR